MPDPEPTDDPRSFDDLERDVLYALTVEREPIWSVDDLGRTVGSAIGAVDAVAGLLRSGLINQTSDGYVFATHAGYRAVALSGATV